MEKRQVLICSGAENYAQCEKAGGELIADLDRGGIKKRSYYVPEKFKLKEPPAVNTTKLSE